MQGGDKMACSAAGYSNKMKRLCRKCDIKEEDAGSPHKMQENQNENNSRYG